jgi:Ca-activated chloride channel family protein
MPDSTQRLFAIGLASCFAAVTSVIIVGIAVENTFWAEDNEALRTAQEPDTSAGSSPDRPAPEPDTSGSRQADEPDRIREPDSPSDAPEVLDDYPDDGPQMVAKGPEGDKVILPMVETDYSVDVRGDLATVTVEQTFENPGQVPLDAQYQLPMSEEAAVYEMIMRVGDRRIRGKVQKKQEARETYEEAKDEGKAAALLEQQRANLFTQKLANVMPNQPVHVTIRYVETVDKIDGRYQMVVPLVVGPRYEPADMSGNKLVDSEQGDDADQPGAGGDEDAQSPNLPPVGSLEAPETIDPDRVSIEARIDGGVPVGDLESPTHAVATSKLDPRNRELELAEGRTIGNRHFVMSYTLEGRSTQAGLLTHWNEDLGQGYFSLLVEPPAEPKEDEIAAREMVFLLDTSGSMSGAPMQAARTYMRETLKNLRPEDTFRIIEFNSGTSSLGTEPMPASDMHVQKGLSYVDRLSGSGGTVMVPGIEQALGPEEPEERVRMVTMLTDGYVGNEYEVIEKVRAEIGGSRFFVLGVGSAPNNFALEEMAEMGRGFTRFIDSARRGNAHKHIRETATEMAEKLETPVMTDLSVDWGGLEPREVTPAKTPDLFDGESVRIMGRYDEPGDYQFTVEGRAGGEPVSLPLDVELPGESTDGRGVQLTWARSRVDDHMHQLMTPDRLRETPLDDEDLKNRVTQLGLTHDLATKWTSFVAVSEKVVNPNPEDNASGTPSEPQANNVTSKGYARNGRTHEAPEPSILGGLLMALLVGLGVVRRQSLSG